MRPAIVALSVMPVYSKPIKQASIMLLRVLITRNVPLASVPAISAEDNFNVSLVGAMKAKPETTRLISAIVMCETNSMNASIHLTVKWRQRAARRIPPES